MPFTVTIQWQPEAAIDSLAPDDRQQVQASLERLRQGNLVDAPQVYQIRGRAGEPDFHVLRVNDRLRLLFTIDQARNEITVHDLISREFAQRYG